MSDSESEEASSAGEEEGGDEPVKKRANHNELERKRRQIQKVRLHELCKAIPGISTDKPSAIQVLQSAKEYIDELNKKSQSLESDIEAITGKKSNASSTLSPPVSAKSKEGRPSRSARAEETAELDAYRKENVQLKARLAELKRKTTSAAASTSAAAAAAAAEGDEDEEDEEDTRSPKLLDFTPSQLQVLRDSSMSPVSHESSSLPSTLSVPPLHSDPQVQSSRRTPVLSRSESASPASSTSPHPILRNIKPEPSLVGGSETAFQLNYRKRKSRADNDFEDAKREYYSRRNSTVEDLRDQQQRISSEVGLLTNFAVQARRASLPYLEGFIPQHQDDD